MGTSAGDNACAAGASRGQCLSMSIEYRLIKEDEYAAINELEAIAFYGHPRPEDPVLMRQYFKPEWTLAAFDGAKPVADVRTVPSARLMAGTQTSMGLISPVTCHAAYRRQGHVRELLIRSLELMRERGQPISGLYTPHDALYRRYGWERAEEKRRLNFDPGDAVFRLPVKPTGGTRPGSADDWQRLDAIYRGKADALNGCLVRDENLWRMHALIDFEDKERRERAIVIWVDETDADRGYVIYQNRPSGTLKNGWPEQDIWIHDFTTLDTNAYYGLWRHIKTHDLASSVTYDAHPEDPFMDLLEDPFVVTATKAEGPMIRIVDVEKAIAARPFAGRDPASFTVRITDESAPWNDGSWRIEAGEGGMRAQKTDASPDAEMSINFLSPLYTGYRAPQLLADAGLITVHDPEALAEMTNAFAVTHTPYTQDYY